MKKHYILILFIAIFFTGCVTSQPELYDYSKLQQSKPKSILILMPTNESLEVKGPFAVLSNVVKPLSELGYYVFPVTLVNDTFKHNGLSEAFDIHKVSLNKLKDIFGADSILYLNIKEYGSSYAILNTAISITVEAKLIDVNTGSILWEKTKTVVQDSSSGSSDLVGMLVNALVSQVLNTTTDASFGVSKITTKELFAPNCNDCLLFGPYSPSYSQDKQLHSAN